MAKRSFNSLAEYLEATDTSQSAFAAQLRVHQSAVNQWVHGERIPRPALALRIHELTGVPLASLLKKVRP